MSSIGAIVVDGRVYPPISPSNTVNASSAPPTSDHQQLDPKSASTPTNTPTEPLTAPSSVPTVPATGPPLNNIPNPYQQVPPLQSNQQPATNPQQHQQQPPPPQTVQSHIPQSYIQHYATHNMPPRSSPQTSQHQPQRLPYNVNYNRMQQPLLMQQRPMGNCHQQQVTSSTHPHQQVHLDQMGQNASLRGLLAHNPPSFRPSTNHVPYRLLSNYRYPPNTSQRPPPVPGHNYQNNNSMVSGMRLPQQCNPNTQSMSHIPHYNMQQQQQQQQQIPAKWHIPQNVSPCLPFYSRHQTTPPVPVPINDTYKITLRNQQANNIANNHTHNNNINHPSNVKYNANMTTTNSESPQLQSSPSIGHTVSSSVPKTPSPIPPGKPDETERSLDKFCQKSLNDLMLTIAKLDSNGIVVIPEAQKNQMDSTQVDSSTDEAIHSIPENSTGTLNI